jgi:hypothetical protein
MNPTCIACHRLADNHSFYGSPSCAICAHNELADGNECDHCDYRRPAEINGLSHLQQMAGADTTDTEAAWLRDHLIDLNVLQITRFASGDEAWFLWATDSQWDAAVAAMAAITVEVTE